MQEEINPVHFSLQVECNYNGENYSVRNNGEVMRHVPIGRSRRNVDGIWTFGEPNNKTDYLQIASVPVHAIIATAFHGSRPGKEYVVDHIDENKFNNRPENLRWVTRIVNLLLNPVTAKRIAKRCGTVEAFLIDPGQFKAKFKGEKYEWIADISIQHAGIALDDLFVLAGIQQRPSRGALDRWLVNRLIWAKHEIEATPALIMAKTLNVAQRDWSVPSEFPCCPQAYKVQPILTYAAALEKGAVFCHNHLYTSLVSKASVSDEQQVITILTENKDGLKPWSVVKITFEDDLFIHASLGTFVTEKGAEKQFCLAQGLKWSGGDTIDDFM